MNCKPGDIAVVVRSPHEGLIVEVLTPEHSLSQDLPGWIVRLQRPRVLYVATINGYTGETEFGTEVCVPDAYLRPLRGEPEHETTDNEQEITA